MFIPAERVVEGWGYQSVFQSLDWVDVYSGIQHRHNPPPLPLFQSLDWVDVYSGTVSGAGVAHRI